MKDYVKCDVCGALNPPDADRCKICGTVFNKEMAKCEVCGNIIPLDANVCPYCGAVFNKSSIPIPPAKEKSRFLRGMAIGILIGILISTAIIYPFYIIPMEKQNDTLNEQLESLETMYTNLSMRYGILNNSYNILEGTNSNLQKDYQEKIDEYDSLLLNYTKIETKYDNLMNPPSDMKFIVVLYFTTHYFDNSKQYWIFLKIDVKDFMGYRNMSHPYLTTNYQQAKEYVVVDKYMEEIVSIVKSKLVDGTDEELVDSLMSLAQNKADVFNMSSDVSDSMDNTMYGTYYWIDKTMKYPVETLVMHSGECMDDVILFQSLVKAAGLNGAFIFYPNKNHVQGGVKITEPSHSGSDLWLLLNDETIANVDGYYVAEITRYGWKIGQLQISWENEKVIEVIID